MDCAMTSPIEAGVRALARACNPHNVKGKNLDAYVEIHWSQYKSHATACIEAAIASGALVPASQLAAERERCAKACDNSSRAYEALVPSHRGLVLKHRTEGMAHGARLAASKIRALEPASGEFVVGWRDIRSAPKDGTPFLAWEGEERGPFKCWMHQGFSTDEYYWMDHQDSEPDPTHWMPLPEPPAMMKDGSEA
jgi:hypothetical protein